MVRVAVPDAGNNHLYIRTLRLDGTMSILPPQNISCLASVYKGTQLRYSSVQSLACAVDISSRTLRTPHLSPGRPSHSPGGARDRRILWTLPRARALIWRQESMGGVGWGRNETIAVRWIREEVEKSHMIGIRPSDGLIEVILLGQWHD